MGTKEGTVDLLATPDLQLIPSMAQRSGGGAVLGEHTQLNNVEHYHHEEHKINQKVRQYICK